MIEIGPQRDGARLGVAGQGRAWLGAAGRGGAGLGMARHGTAWQGKARLTERRKNNDTRQ